MAVLTARARKKLPASKFALPEKDGYPVQDRAHQINAKARATQMLKAGKLSPANAARIRRKANVLLGKGAD